MTEPIGCVVVGAGQMGALIAAEIARVGKRVALVDRSVDALGTARRMMATALHDATVRGLMTPAAASAAESRVLFTTAPSEAADARFLVEVVPENLALKQSVFRQYERELPQARLFATCSMNLDPVHMGMALVDPAMLVGIRFLWPVLLIPTVVVREHEGSTSVSRARVAEFLQFLGKTCTPYDPEKPFYRLNDSDARAMQTNCALAPMATAASAPIVGWPTPSNGADEQTNSTRNNGDDEHNDAFLCLICFNSPKNSLLTPCGHVAICMDCAQELHRNQKNCPICRVPIREIIRSYIV